MVESSLKLYCLWVMSTVFSNHVSTRPLPPQRLVASDGHVLSCECSHELASCVPAHATNFQSFGHGLGTCMLI